MYLIHLNIYFHYLLRTNPRLMKLSDSLLDFIFSSLSIFNSITMIYEHGYNSLTFFKSLI